MSNIDDIQVLIQKASFAARGKSISKRRRRNLSIPSAKWIAPSLIGDSIGKALSIVFATVGCSHARGETGGCTMCSYLLDGSESAPSDSELFQQFESAMSALTTEEAPISIKLYTSGSFLDIDEIPGDVQKSILKVIAEDDRVEEIVIESRPEFVTDEVLSDLREVIGKKRVEIGIGLESANNLIRSICINKNFDLENFQQALLRAKSYDIGIRAYVLLKPPFLTESDAIDDTTTTIQTAAKMGVTTISVNPVNIQKNTLVERLWFKGKYRPPWLWSLVEVLFDANELIPSPINVVCDPVAAGKPRGVHNCGQCDSNILAAIREFSLNQDRWIFSDLDCECKEQWKHILTHEDASFLIHRER